MSTEQTYDNIDTLEGLEAVRHRPGMYVGSVVENEYDSAPNHLVKEGVGNSIDEFLGSHATFVWVSLLADGIITIEDDGRGIPFSFNEKKGMSNLELAATQLHAGAKFAKGEDKAFKFSAGLHGIGLKAICALSEWLKITVWRDGKQATMEFSKGKVLEKLKIIDLPKSEYHRHGTKIEYKQDRSILPNNPRAEHVRQYLTFCAWINAGCKFKLTVGDKDEDLSQPRGLVAMAEHYVGRDHWKVAAPLKISATDEAGNTIETLIVFTDREGDQHLAFVNGGAINQASAPVVAIRGAAAKGVGSAIEATFGKMPDSVTTADMRSGLLTVSKILHVDPAYDSQTKEKLVNVDLNPMINKEVVDAIVTALMADHDTLTYLRNHINLIVKAREAAKAARDKAMGKDVKITTPKSQKAVPLNIYTPPLSVNPKVNQLFMFEGESAAGSLISASKEKDPNTGKLYKEHIGILALRGVMMGTYKVKLAEILARSPQYAMLVDKSGLNPNNRDDLSGLKYNQFVIATDEDSGGMHIASQLLAFFVYHFPEVVRQGRLVRIRTPLFEAERKGLPSVFIYAWEDKEEVLIANGLDPNKAGKSFNMKRSKGLGQLSIKARTTLVSGQKFDVYQHDDPEELHPMLEQIVGNDTDVRKDIMFNIALPEEVD